MSVTRASLAAALAIGCSASAPPAPSPAGAWASPARLGADLVPGDIGILVRLDRERLRRAGLDAAAGVVLRRALPPAAAGIVERLGPRVRTLYVGARCLSDGCRGDGVVVAEGDFADADPGPPETPGAIWPVASVGGGAARWYDARPPPSDRRALAAVVVLGTRAVAMATAAEADAMRRVIDAGPDADRLDPPAEGAVSFEARGRDVVVAIRSRAPALAARIGTGLDRARGTAAVDGGVVFAADLHYDGTAEAREAGRAIAAIVAGMGAEAGAPGGVARAVRVEVRENEVRISGGVPRAVLVDGEP